MPNIVINFAEADFTTEFKALAAGEYLSKVSDAQLRKNQNTGNWYVNITYEIQKPDDIKGRKVWDSIYLTEKSMFRLAIYLKAMGIPVKERGFTFSMTEDDQGNISIPQFWLGKEDENGNTPFYGFITDDGEKFSIIDAVVKLTLSVRSYKNSNGDDRETNNVDSLELVGKLPSAPNVAEDGNSGDRPALM